MKWMKILAMAAVLALGLCGALTAWAQPPEKDIVRIIGQPEGGHLGIHLRDVRSEDVSALKLPAERGAIVEDVIEGSPAAEAGLAAKDVIVEFEGQAVLSAAALTRMVRETPPGRKVTLSVLRDGQRKSVSARLGEGKGAFAGVFPKKSEFRFEGRPFDFDFDLDVFPKVGPGIIRRSLAPARLGIHTQDLSDQLAEYFKVPGKAGVLVTSVNENSAAQKAGIKAGDVIVAVDGKTVTDTEDLREAIGRDATKVQLDAIRNGQKMTFTVTLESPTPKPRARGVRI